MRRSLLTRLERLEAILAPKQAKLRAADLVLSHGAKAIEIEDIEARVAELERAAEEAKKTR